MTHKPPLIGDLRTRRLTLGWSIAELGKRCGIDEKLLGDWEHGIGSPRLDELELWATALNVKLAMLPAVSNAGPGLRVDWQVRHVTVDGASIRLTPMEWKALERLARSPGELVTHQELFSYLYGEGRHYRAESTAVRVLITKLRRLLPIHIEAQWGKGYVIGGVEASLMPEKNADDSVGDGHAAVEPPVAKPSSDCMPERMAFAAGVARRPAPPIRREVVSLGEPTARRFAAPAPRLAQCRSDELGVIERFLAERGATRCPDVGTIQNSPLPTLVWDKVKRKWVRPSQPGREAS